MSVLMCLFVFIIPYVEIWFSSSGRSYLWPVPRLFLQMLILENTDHVVWVRPYPISL